MFEGMWKTEYMLDTLIHVRIYCKSIFQDGDHKLEILSVLHITFTAFALMLDSVWLWCFSSNILKCDMKMNSGLNDNSGIKFADKQFIIIDSNIV